MRKIFCKVAVVTILLNPFVLTGCGGDANRVVKESEELSFDKMDEMAAKETEEAEENPE